MGYNSKLTEFEISLLLFTAIYCYLRSTVVNTVLRGIPSEPVRHYEICLYVYVYIYIYMIGGWTARDRIPVGTRFSARLDRPWGPPSLLYNGYRVFPGDKVRPGRAADHSPHSSAVVMEE